MVKNEWPVKCPVCRLTMETRANGEKFCKNLNMPDHYTVIGTMTNAEYRQWVGLPQK